MRRALADYALGSGEKEEDHPLQEKSNLFALLDEALELGCTFCKNLGIDLDQILREEETFDKISLFDQYADKLLERDAWKNEFFVYENTITSLYEACKPEILEEEQRPLVPVFQYLRSIIETKTHSPNIHAARQKISELLDQSVVTSKGASYVSDSHVQYGAIQEDITLDLSELDFEKLREEFKYKAYKNIEIAELRALIEDKLEKMLRRNAARVNFVQRYQAIIDNYNAGGSSNENYYRDLLSFTEELKEEEERHIREGLSEDELELFDILKKEKASKEEEKLLKLAAKALLRRLMQKRPKVLVQDWYKDSQSRAGVSRAIEEVLDQKLPGSYDREVFQAKRDAVFNLVYKYSSEGLKWAA
jgi:type I restriction enzyme R subunit